MGIVDRRNPYWRSLILIRGECKRLRPEARAYLPYGDSVASVQCSSDLKCIERPGLARGEFMPPQSRFERSGVTESPAA